MAAKNSSMKHYQRFFTKWDEIRKLNEEPLTIVLSPHMDDIFLSLNSFISAGELGKNVIGINVFTLTDSLVDTNVKLNFGVLSSTSLERLKEEVEYSAYLKGRRINYLPIFLGFKDAAVETYYRYIAGKKIRSLPSVLGIDEKARRLQWKYAADRYEQLGIGNAIKQVMAQFDGSVDEVLAPIGIGDHIDHMMLRVFADRSLSDFKVGLYADIPYIQEYGYNTVEKLKSVVPRSFKRYDRKSFDAAGKNRLFRRIYRSQYESGMMRVLDEIANTTGEVIFWGR